MFAYKLRPSYNPKGASFSLERRSQEMRLLLLLLYALTMIAGPVALFCSSCSQRRWDIDADKFSFKADAVAGEARSGSGVMMATQRLMRLRSTVRRQVSPTGNFVAPRRN